MATEIRERQPRAKDLFLDVIDLQSPQHREAYLDSQCGDDQELRQTVEDLLRHHDRLGGFLEIPPPCGLASELVPPVLVIEGPGSVVGPYQLVSEIARGGMGVVYLAEQAVPVKRQVALKVIKPGMDTRQVLSRFEAERQALAMMNHPNIAQVLDAGATETGRPYFVMELVDGLPITKYCQAEGLTIRQRVELFVLVCRAVQHAHQKGIIHRDLKPSNVMVVEVDGLATPKVIDFGVAKAITPGVNDETGLTHLDQLIGTPIYMSPEQAGLGNLDVDTRSDVYSLGALLYELLTGTTPIECERFRHASYDEMRRLIQSNEPPAPSTRLDGLSVRDGGKSEGRQLARELRGELDWIVMKCLEKERSERYETANGVAADLTRYLAGKPVEAVPRGAVYRLSKSIKRNRVFLTTVGLVGLALLAGVVASTLLAIRAMRAEGRVTGALRVAEERQAISDRHLYAARLRLARDALDENQVERAQEILAEVNPLPDDVDPRDFAWGYLRGLARREVIEFPRHSSGVSGLILFDGGRRLAYGTKSGEIYVVDAATEEILVRLKGHTLPIQDLAVSADGQTLVSAGESRGMLQGEILIWDLKRRLKLGQLIMPKGYGAHQIWLTKTGSLLSVWAHPADRAQQHKLLSYDLRRDRAQPKELETFDLSVTTTPSVLGKVVSVESPAIIDLLDGERKPMARAASKSVGAFIYSPDGEKCIEGTSGPDGGLVVINMETGAEESRLALSDVAIQRMCVSEWASTVVAIDYWGQVVVWDRVGGTSRRILPEGAGRGGCSVQAGLSMDGKLLALSTWGIPGGATPDQVYEVSTGAILATFPGRVLRGNDPVFASDNRSLFIESGNAIKRWKLDVSKPVELEGHKDEAWSLAYSPDGKYLISGSDDTDEPETLKVWELATGRLLSASHPHEATVSALAISPDGRRLATACFDVTQNLRLWDTSVLTDTKQWKLIQTMDGHADKVRTVAYSPDGKLLVSGGTDGSIQLWDGVTGRSLGVLLGHEPGVRQVAFSPDGRRLASASNEGTVRVWSVSGRRCLAVYRGPSPYTSVAFSPCGNLLAAADQQGLITLLDPETGLEIRHIYSEDSEARTLAFAPDGRTLAAAGMGKVIRIWDVQTSQELLTLESHTAQINALVFSPDGQTLASADHSGAVRLWMGERKEEK